MENLLQLPYVKSVAVAAVFALLFVLERLYPVATWQGGLWRVARNLGLSLFNFAAGPLIVLPLTLYASGHALQWRPDWMSGWLGLGFDLLLLDFWIYWWHRVNHELPLLWRFHAVHHLDETLDSSSALRFHFGEVLLSSLVRAAVIWLLDIPFASVLVFETLVVMSSLFHHSNLKLPPGLERVASWIVVTPSIHWVHHHALRKDTDSNYATVLSLWDRLFSSRSSTQRDAGMAIGVEQQPEEDFTQLITRPFRRG